MSTSPSSSSGSQPGSNPAAITIDPELAGRLVAALELIGIGYGYDSHEGDRRKPDPTRLRAAQDYDVLRGLLGRTDAPRALRMHRTRIGGSGQKSQTGGDNAIVIDDPIPALASLAVVESLRPASGPVREAFHIQGGTTPKPLELTNITAVMPISRVEIYDDDRNLLAFGPSAAAIA